MEAASSPVKVNEHTIGYVPMARQVAAQCRRAGQEAEPERGLLPAPRAQRRRSRRDRQPPLPYPEPVACRGGLPGFREQTLTYMDTMEALCRKLVRLYALALDLPEDHFDDCFAKPHMILRQSRYPAIDGGDDTIASLVAAHRLPIHDLAAAQQGAGPVDPAAQRAVDGGAGRRRTPSWSTAATSCTAGPTSASCRRRTACATSRARCATPCRSSAIPTTTP